MRSLMLLLGSWYPRKTQARQAKEVAALTTPLGCLQNAPLRRVGSRTYLTGRNAGTLPTDIVPLLSSASCEV